VTELRVMFEVFQSLLLPGILETELSADGSRDIRNIVMITEYDKFKQIHCPSFEMLLVIPVWAAFAISTHWSIPKESRTTCGVTPQISEAIVRADELANGKR